MVMRAKVMAVSVERVVWVWSEGEEMCWFAGILILKGIGFVFWFCWFSGFLQRVAPVLGRRLGVGEVGFV